MTPAGHTVRGCSFNRVGTCRASYTRGFSIRVGTESRDLDKMDNRELNLAIPERRTESLASQDGMDAEEEDESEIQETLEFVTYM